MKKEYLSYLNTMPNEIIWLILRFLNPTSLTKIGKTNRELSAFMQDPKWWSSYHCQTSSQFTHLLSFIKSIGPINNDDSLKKAEKDIIVRVTDSGGFCCVLLTEQSQRPNRRTIAMQQNNDFLTAYWDDSQQIVEKSLGVEDVETIFQKLSREGGCSSDQDLIECIASKYSCTMWPTLGAFFNYLKSNIQNKLPENYFDGLRERIIKNLIQCLHCIYQKDTPLNYKSSTILLCALDELEQDLCFISCCYLLETKPSEAAKLIIEKRYDKILTCNSLFLLDAYTDGDFIQFLLYSSEPNFLSLLNKFQVDDWAKYIKNGNFLNDYALINAIKNGYFTPALDTATIATLIKKNSLNKETITALIQNRPSLDKDTIAALIKNHSCLDEAAIATLIKNHLSVQHTAILSKPKYSAPAGINHLGFLANLNSTNPRIKEKKDSITTNRLQGFALTPIPSANSVGRDRSEGLPLEESSHKGFKRFSFCNIF
jgi:hypothetical protein